MIQLEGIVLRGFIQGSLLCGGKNRPNGCMCMKGHMIRLVSSLSYIIHLIAYDRTVLQRDNM